MKISQKSNSGLIIILILALLPILLWLIFPAPLPRFSSLTIGLSNIGQIFGLVGASLFAINLILSARFKSLEKIFNGLNGVYLQHDQLGQIALMLLLFHPLLLIPKYASGSFVNAALFLLPSANIAINLGIYSLALMIFLIILTLYLRPKYNIWKWTHKFLGLAFFLASIHIWLIPSDISRNIPLRTYMLGLSIIAILCFIYKSLLGNIFIKKFEYIVTEIKLLNDSTVKITMKSNSKQLTFSAGQFIFVSFQSEISSESHPFTISSSPDEKELIITAKNLGDYTKKLANLKIGTITKIEGPFGVFSYKNSGHKNQIWIAGGIGITPFLSMIKTLQQNDNHNIDLYYCTRNESEIIYPDFLKNISSSLNNSLRIINHYSDSQGFINADIIKKMSVDLIDKDLFICAPPPMIRSLKKQFIAKGVNKKFIYSEEFNF
ncbi:MAG: ferredoxin reductase family protein [Candidatus Buchananbacteria bacterium]